MLIVTAEEPSMKASQCGRSGVEMPAQASQCARFGFEVQSQAISCARSGFEPPGRRKPIRGGSGRGVHAAHGPADRSWTVRPSR
jgi:hypothetical protein